MRRIFRWLPRQLSELQRLLFIFRVIRCSDAPHRKFRCLRRKSNNGYERLVRLDGLYKDLIPAILELLESRDATPTLAKSSKPTKELLDQIPRFSTCFVNESARLAQV